MHPYHTSKDLQYDPKIQNASSMTIAFYRYCQPIMWDGHVNVNKKSRTGNLQCLYFFKCSCEDTIRHCAEEGLLLILYPYHDWAHCCQRETNKNKHTVLVFEGVDWRCSCGTHQQQKLTGPFHPTVQRLTWTQRGMHCQCYFHCTLNTLAAIDDDRRQLKHKR